MSYDMAAVELKLAKAKTSLILSQPFFGSIALGMIYRFSEDIPTAAVTGTTIIMNPEYVDSLTDGNMTFLLAHECMHPMLGHNHRRGHRDPRKWNKACDYVINQLLSDENIGTMPEHGLLNKSIYDAGGGTSEGIYDILEGDDGGSDDFGGQGDPLDDCINDDSLSPAEQSQLEQEWTVKAVQAVQAAKMVGKLPESIERLIDALVNAKVPWQEVLQRFMVRAKNDSRSFARFNRRFISQGLYLPSASGETVGSLVFAIDCSGSIDQTELDQYAAEISQVKEDFNPTSLTVIYFDAEVSHVETYGPDDALDIKMHGGGGTDFAPIFEKILELDLDPAAIVILTDLDCDSFGVQPDAPVLWVSTYRDEAPFGEVVMMEN